MLTGLHHGDFELIGNLIWRRGRGGAEGAGVFKSSSYF